MKKHVLTRVLALALAAALCAGAAMAAPPPPPTEEADSYTGPVIEYPDKALWFDSTVYGGFFSAYQIVSGNGSEGFDIDAFINSRQGELLMSRAKYELALLGGDAYASQTMIDFWAENGVIETAYASDDPTHEWLAFAPSYMMTQENTEKYPVVFSFHGNGNTLFTGVNLGFVHICYEEGFIVVVPEAENSDGAYMAENLDRYLDELEANGYPIDRTRIYTSGMSKGGHCSMYLAQERSDVIAAASAHGSAFAFDPSSEFALDSSSYAETPLYLACGEFDLGQLPMSETARTALSNWSAALGGGSFAATDNLLGLFGGRTYEQAQDGTVYNIADAYDADGVNVMKIVGVEGLPHWVSYSYSKLAWDFMKQFSRVDGELVKATAEEPEEPTPPSPVTYTVVKGDTLWGIASRHLGSGYQWTAIYDANLSIIKDPNLIYVGQVLTIPGN